MAQRYLVKPAQAAQAAQQAGIEVGTKEGLKALLEQLYLGPDRVSMKLVVMLLSHGLYQHADLVAKHNKPKCSV